jgi:hypothetical protein
MPWVTYGAMKALLLAVLTTCISPPWPSSSSACRHSRLDSPAKRVARGTPGQWRWQAAGGRGPAALAQQRQHLARWVPAQRQQARQRQQATQQ